MRKMLLIMVLLLTTTAVFSQYAYYRGGYAYGRVSYGYGYGGGGGVCYTNFPGVYVNTIPMVVTQQPVFIDAQQNVYAGSQNYRQTRQTEKRQSDGGDSNQIQSATIQNSDGTFTVIPLTKVDGGYVGPKGEFYSSYPSLETLKKNYNIK
jgi:hypothetical protein